MGHKPRVAVLTGWATVALILVACGSEHEPAEPHAVVSASASGITSISTEAVPSPQQLPNVVDVCTFLTREQVKTAVGRPLPDELKQRGKERATTDGPLFFTDQCGWAQHWERHGSSASATGTIVKIIVTHPTLDPENQLRGGPKECAIIYPAGSFHCEDVPSLGVGAYYSHVDEPSYAFYRFEDDVAFLLPSRDICYLNVFDAPGNGKQVVMELAQYILHNVGQLNS